MTQYIDKAAVVAELEDWRDKIKKGIFSIPLTGSDRAYATFEYEILGKVRDFLDTLEVKDEVVATDPTSPNSLKISRHGNSHIEAMKEALRMEYEKGRADVLRCIDPDEMVADFCSQPFSKTRSIASVYRQGIMDILKRINSNEKTSITGTLSIDDVGL